MDIVKYTKDSLFQRLKSYYIDQTSVMLTDKEQQKLSRLVNIWGLRINDKYSAHQAVQIIMRDYNVSRATAYRDYAWAQQLFGEIDATHIAAERQILKEAYWQLYQKQCEQGDYEAAKKSLDSYKSLFDFGTPEHKADPNKIQAHEYHLHMPRWVFKKMDAIMNEGVFDFNQLDVEDVDFKEDSENA